MMNNYRMFCFTVMCFLSVDLAYGAGHHIKESRVPVDKLEEARSLTSPFPFSGDLIQKGKVIYEGKGTCINCHGKNGYGDGPGALNLVPRPRVFRSGGFWRHRTDGEVFWVIKYGSPGTAMIPFGGLLTDEEIWMVMQYERSFSGRHGRRHMREHDESMRHRGERGRKGGHGMGGKKHHRGRMSDDCCQ